MKIRFNKLQTTKNEKDEVVKLHFSGGFNSLDLTVIISGDKEFINDFKTEQRLERFGQQLEVRINNPQTTLED